MIEAPYSELDYSSDYLDEFHGFTDEDDNAEEFNDRADGEGSSPVAHPKKFKEDQKRAAGIDFELDSDLEINPNQDGNPGYSEDETMKFTREE